MLELVQGGGGELLFAGEASEAQASSTLHPTPYTLRPTPYALRPTPYALRPTPYTLHSTPYALNPTPYTRCSRPLHFLSLAKFAKTH